LDGILLLLTSGLLAIRGQISAPPWFGRIADVASFFLSTTFFAKQGWHGFVFRMDEKRTNT
jgi:hypothetical protein